MKNLSKKIISLMLALIMAMPMMFALPQTASAAAGDGKILEWNFTGSSKPTISSPTASVNDSYDQTVSSTYGSATLNLHNWSTGDRHFHYDNDTEGMKSTDGVASLRNLSSYLADGKDIDIQFTMSVNGNTTASNKGVFAIGSNFDDYSTTANNANDLVYLSNTGDMRYRSTSSNTDIHLNGTSSVTQNSYFNYRIYFTYSSHKIDIYRNNILIGSVTNGEIDKNDFVCLVIGTHIPNNFGNFAIKKLSISQYASSEQADFSNFSAESTVASSSIKAFNGTAYIYSSAATGGYTTGTVVHHTTGNTDYSNSQNVAYMDHCYYAPKNLVLAYDGTKTLTFPVAFGQKRQNGDHTQKIHDVSLQSGTNLALQQNWRGYTDMSGSYSTTNAPWSGMSGSSQINYVYNSSSSYVQPDNNNTWRAYANFITYTGKVNNNNDGSVNTSANYFEKLGSMVFRYRGEFKKTSWGKTTYPVEEKDVTISGYSVYILNYKPIYDILKSSTPTTVNVNGNKNIRDLRTYLLTGDGSWMYTNASRAEALRRINAVGEVDPNAYGYNSDASTDVALCANEIKNAYEKFVDIPNILVKNTFTITYDMLGTDKSATVVAGNNISNKSSGDAIPSLTATAYIGNNQHNVYSWSSSGVWDSTSAPSGTHVPHSNETYTENRATLACDHNTAGTPVASDDLTHNGYTDYSCSVCGNTDTKDRVYVALNWGTYNTNLGIYTTKTTTEAGNYTTSSVSTCVSNVTSAISGINQATMDGSNTPQTTVDTAANAISTQVGNLVRRASFTALDLTYNSVKDSYDALDSSLYTTSSFALVQTFFNTAANFTYHSKNEAERANTAESSQSAIDDEKDAIAAALNPLEEKASFTALDTAKNNAIDALDAAASANTTSSVSAARTYLTSSAQFPYEYTADRNNTGVSHNDAIAAEATKFGNWQTASPLEAKASFTALDAAKQEWTDYLTAHSAEYTTSSKAALSDYINSTTEFPLENDADRADTGVSRNDDISDEIDKYGEIDITDSTNEDTYLDPVADLTYFDAEYDKANTFLVNLDGKAAEYTADSMAALITAVEKPNVGVYTSANAAARADYGQAVQADADDLADDIKDAMAGLKTVETVAPSVDTSTLKAAIVQLNNADPDAYDLNSESISSAQSTVNSLIGDEDAQIDYNGATINVLSDDLSQPLVDDVVRRIKSALTVSTKSYDVIKDAEGDTSFSISARNGSYSAGSATYGTTIVCDSGNAETAWYLEIETSSMHKKMAFQYYGQRLTTKVLGETTVRAVKKGTEQKKVKIIRKYGDAAITDKSPVQLVDYLNSGDSFTLPAAPAIALYTFDGYYIGETKYAAGASVTISEDTDIIARYTVASGADCAINAKDVSGASHNSTVSYNTKVELQGGEGTYAWVEEADSTGTHFRPFFIGANVSFYASESTNLKAVTKAEFDEYKFSLPAVNLRKSGVTVVDGKKTFNAQIVPAGANVQEYGILIAAPSGANPLAYIDETKVVIENSGSHSSEGYSVLRAKSTKLVGANQFTIAVNSLPNGYVYRGYLIYADSAGKLHNVYSEAMR